MRRILICMALFLMATAAFSAPSNTAAPVRQASFDEQLREMGYLILHLSRINLYNGLNLSRQQLVQLRDLSRQIDQTGAKPPVVHGEGTGALKTVHDTYRELEGKLLEGEEIDKSLEAKVAKARILESGAIRRSIRPTPSSNTALSCARCHAENAGSAEPASAPNAKSADPLAVYSAPAMRREIYMAHTSGVYGAKGLSLLYKQVGQANSVLTDAQRELVSDFSCCLVPPKNLSDPVRVGQAAVDEKTMNLLRKARAMPDNQWPAGRRMMMAGYERGQEVRSPGATERQKDSVSERIGQVFDKARKMTDVEFEMEKENLCADIKKTEKPAVSNQKGRDFQTASFLLLPGATGIFSRMIDRLDKVAASK